MKSEILGPEIPEDPRWSPSSPLSKHAAQLAETGEREGSEWVDEAWSFRPFVFTLIFMAITSGLGLLGQGCSPAFQALT